MADFVHVEGLKELQDRMQELGNRVARKVLRRAVVAGGKLIRDEAKNIAPEYHGAVSEGHPPPGTLKRAISFGRSNRDSGPGKEVVNVFVRQAKNGSVGSKKVKAYGKFDAYYWRFVEFGTSKMEANPFMRPAFDSNKENAVEIIKATLAEGVEQEAAQIGKP